MVACNDDLRSELVAARDREADKAWRSLARYKLWMFGYHAAAWVKFNQLLPSQLRSRNPFRELVLLARAKLAETPS